MQSVITNLEFFMTTPYWFKFKCIEKVEFSLKENDWKNFLKLMAGAKIYIFLASLLWMQNCIHLKWVWNKVVPKGLARSYDKMCIFLDSIWIHLNEIQGKLNNRFHPAILSIYSAGAVRLRQYVSIYSFGKWIPYP